MLRGEISPSTRSLGNQVKGRWKERLYVAIGGLNCTKEENSDSASAGRSTSAGALAKGENSLRSIGVACGHRGAASAGRNLYWDGR